jgi:hypothetical protein
MVKALRRWLEANELLAIVTGVAGALVVLSDMLSQHGSRPRVRPRLDIDRPQVPIVDILQGHRHDLRSAVDIDTAEELQSKTWCEILALFRGAALLKHRLRTERIVQFAGSPCPGMKRT